MTCENLHEGDIVEYKGRMKKVGKIATDCPDGHHQVEVYDLELEHYSYFDDRSLSVFGDISKLVKVE